MRLRLYVRVGCGLCEEMHRELLSQQEFPPFDLQLVDIDTDERMRERFDHMVPVLAGDGGVICHHYFDRDALSDYFLSH